MRWSGKCCKKILSCILAAAITVTGGSFQGETTAHAEDTAARYLTYEVAGNTWRLYDQGIVADQNGIMYQLKQDTSGEASVSSYLTGTALAAVIVIPDTIPWTYSVYDKQWTLNSGQPSGTQIGSVSEMVDSSTVTAVDEAALKNAAVVQEITLSDTISEIGDYAFAGCTGLTKLSIPDSVVDFGIDILNGAAGCTIYCSAGSKAQQYAQENSYNYSTGSASESTASPSPSATETPAVSQSPASTGTPAVSQSPTAVETPAVSQSPTATGIPAVSQSPTATGTPAVSQSPTATGTPAVSQSPTATGTTPAGTRAPMETVTPSVTAGPSTLPTVTPDAGQTTAPVETPQASEKPGVTLLPSPAATDPGTAPSENKTVEQKNMKYTVIQGKAVLNSSSVGNVTNLVIPSSIVVNGTKYPVNKIAPGAFKSNKKLKKVELGSNVTTVGEGAFRGCSNLTSIKFSNRLKTLKKNCFNGCKSLKTVNIPDSVTKIGKGAFKGCISLKKMTIGSKPAKKGGVLVIDGKQVLYGAGTVKIDIGAQALANCRSLTSLVINRMVTRIGNSAFKGCTSLSDIIVRSLQLQRVDKGALTGVSNCKISVPTKKVKPYSVLFKNKGQGKKVVVAKI